MLQDRLQPILRYVFYKDQTYIDMNVDDVMKSSSHERKRNWKHVNGVCKGVYEEGLMYMNSMCT